ncbi:MAG: hypothetical protein HOV80_29775 [Polyangiaceae bacterium]|nr:hypothetical protein [Polyangiaceae bacterium]
MATRTAAAEVVQASQQAELEEEIRQAEAEFARGEFIDVTVDDLDRALVEGKWPWPRVSSE